MLDQRIIDVINENKGFVAIIAGSGSDDKSPDVKEGEKQKPSHIEKIVSGLESFKLAYGVNIYSAHKQPEEAKAIILEYNQLVKPILIVAVAGSTDALSGIASWSSYHPVVSCPPDGLNMSCLNNPSGSANAYILRPDNVAKFAAQMFSYINPECASILRSSIYKKTEELIKDNARINEKYIDRLLQSRGR